MFEIKTQFSDEMTWATSLGTYIARDLVNEPLSHLNAEIFSKKVKTLGKDAGFKVDVLDEQKN
jgi:leucyl aminopeptidase